ncbi:hypothetical protein ACF1GT_30010 [Streptomyces sp. NPDC014636]|uniref:hypothetical protein n=1 Tax=Streptomyces sp. NPDC014636 TaxID=3364876 RepID=UPI0036FD4FD1
MTTTAATGAEEWGAHPRFAAAPRALGLADVRARARRFPEASRTAAGAAATGCEPSRTA